MALSVIKQPLTPKIDTIEGIHTAAVIDIGGEADFYEVGHGLTNGDYVYVISDAYEYNGMWYVQVNNSDNFKIKEYATASNVDYVKDITATWYKLIAPGEEYLPVHSPIVYKLASTLWPTNSVDTVRTVSSYANDLGYVKLTLSGAHGCSELEFVKITFTGGTTAVYQVLTWYSTTVITINLPYVGGLTFVGVQKYYLDYHAKIKIYAGLDLAHPFESLKPYEELCEIMAVPDSNGVITININEHLKSRIGVLKNAISDASMPNAIDSFCQFYISYAEAYSYSEGGYTLLDYVGAYTDDGDDFYAINSKMPFKTSAIGMADYIVALVSPPGYILKSKFLTTMSPHISYNESDVSGPVSQFFDISFIVNNTLGATRIRREFIRGGVVVGSSIDSVSSFGIGVYRYEVVVSAYLEDAIYLTVETDYGSGYVPSSETMIITVDGSCGDNYIDLSWLNHCGGFDYWRFKSNADYGVNITDTTKSTKNLMPEWPKSYGEFADTIEQETSRRSKQTVTVIAENLTETQVQDLFRIKLSPLVQIVNSRTDRRTVIPDKSSFKYFKQSEKEYSVTLEIEYTDEFPSQSL